MSKKVRGLFEKWVPEFKLDANAGIAEEFNEVVLPQFYQYGAGTEKAQMSTDYYMNDSRLCLEGEEILVGIPSSAIRGDSITEMFDAFKALGTKEFIDRVKIDGFFARLTPGCMAVLPANFAFVSLAVSKEVHGIRVQNFGNQATRLRCVEGLNATISAFPSYEGETHGKIRDYLVALAA